VGDQDPDFAVKSPDHEMPARIRDVQDADLPLTVASIVEIVSRHMYAPTAATTGLLLCHHQTHVSPNHTPEIAQTTAREARNAQGESPPVIKRPPQKNRLRDGYCSYFLFRGFTGIAESEGFAFGGSGLNNWLGVGE